MDENQLGENCIAVRSSMPSTSSNTMARICTTARGELARLLRDTEAGILLNEHIAEDGPTVFAHACRLGAEGIRMKRPPLQYKVPGHEADGDTTARICAISRSWTGRRRWRGLLHSDGHQSLRITQPT
jgi:hypothetical protein